MPRAVDYRHLHPPTHTKQNAPNGPPPTTLAIAIPISSDVHSAPTCLHGDRTFDSRLGPIGRLRIHRTVTGAPVPGAPTHTRRIRLHCPHKPNTLGTSAIPPIPSPINFPSTSVYTTFNITTTTDPTFRNLSYPHCHHTFTSRTGLVGHLRTGEPVPGAPTCTRRHRLTCPQCPRTFSHRMGL
ncbi:hypothetical protein SprV_0602119100 [Sparganum proliferum]